jgi:predicted nucleic acid-binding protein
MAVKVVDASALAALLFGEPEAEAVAERLQDAHLVAPVLCSYELANVCVVKCRRHPGESDALLAAYRLRNRLAVEEVQVDYEASLALALTTGLTLYDASYLWVARQLGAELVTLDKELDRTAASA